MLYKIGKAIISGRKRLCYFVNCTVCGIEHPKQKEDFIKGMKTNKVFFCTRSCFAKYNTTKIEVNCEQCNVTFVKKQNQIKNTKHNFCSKSCAATYNNKNKAYGIRRSKLEKIIEQNILNEFSKINFICNDKIAIGSELDFYFPDLRAAIQINGIFHYQPIYGQDKLDKIKILDEEKRNKCQEQNIKLYEIDCSTDKYLNKKLQNIRWNQIKDILNSLLLAEEAGLDPNTYTGTTSFPN